MVAEHQTDVLTRGTTRATCVKIPEILQWVTAALIQEMIREQESPFVSVKVYGTMSLLNSFCASRSSTVFPLRDNMSLLTDDSTFIFAING